MLACVQIQFRDVTLGQGTFGTWPILPSISMVDSVRAYAMPSVPVPPITLLTDMVARCRLLAAHGARSCLSVRTQPLMATGAPSQTSTIPYHTTTSFLACLRHCPSYIQSSVQLSFRFRFGLYRVFSSFFDHYIQSSVKHAGAGEEAGVLWASAGKRVQQHESAYHTIPYHSATEDDGALCG